MPSKILVTGFEPFGGESANPSAQVMPLLMPRGVELITLVLPTEFKRGPQMAINALREHQPHWMVMLGQGGGTGIRPERVAINCADAPIPDNAGDMPQEQVLVPGAPAAYFSGLPLVDLVAAMHRAGVPAQVSNSAGTFVCNALFFQVLHHLAQQRMDCRAGFVHIPLSPAQTLAKTNPSMSLDLCAAAINSALEIMA